MALNEGSKVDDHEILSAQAHLWNHIFSFALSMSLKCAVELGIPDAIHAHGRPMTMSQLVDAIGINPVKTDHLCRIMRLLVHSGIFTGDEEEGYVLTTSSKLLLSTNDRTLSPFLLMMLDPLKVTPHQFLSTWFKGNDPTPFKTANGGSLWDLTSKDSDLNQRFNEAMASDARLAMSIVVKECGQVFQGLKSLVDVGGGNGTAAAALADAFPHLKCSVYDLPHVVESAPKRHNVTMIGGDMFKYIPPSDAIFFKWILHDWNDEDCIKILKRCREAIPSREEGGKVIILDMVLDKKNSDRKALETQFLFDIMMLVDMPGKERYENEWRKIFTAAGFTDYKVTPVLGLRSIIEVYP